MKSAADTDLLTAIRAVAAGQTFVSLPGSTSPPSIEPVHSPDIDDRAALDSMSSREQEVLTLVAQVNMNMAIADRLFLSVKTNEAYRSPLLAKLHLNTRADLTHFALKSGLLQSL